MDAVEVRFHLSGHESLSYGAGLRYIDDSAYHLGFAVKNVQEKGESIGSDRKAIEDAAGQVCKGVNGLLAVIGQHVPVQEQKGTAVLKVMGAVFTTARLFVSSVDLGSADLKTGKLVDSIEVKQVPWLYLQYPMSPALKHNLPTNSHETSLPGLLDHLYMRSIAIISSEGIDDFFHRFDPFD